MPLDDVLADMLKTGKQKPYQSIADKFRDVPPEKRPAVSREMLNDTRFMDSLTGEPRPEAFHRGKAPHYKYEGSYGLRTDGTPKGVGFFGEIPNTDNPSMYSTELSTTVHIDGKKRLIPLLVPTLNKQEIDLLVDSKKAYAPENKPAIDAIVDKAVDFARDRIKRKVSPFAEPNEFHELPKE
jgi:hypothetical protein